LTNTEFANRRPSPTYELPPDEPYNPDEPKEDDSEARSVFVSQLAARLTARDLGYFFEEKLGEGTVMDSRIVTDRLSRRSKGYAPTYTTLIMHELTVMSSESDTLNFAQLI